MNGFGSGLFISLRMDSEIESEKLSKMF